MTDPVARVHVPERAIRERILRQACDAVGDRYVGQAAAPGESAAAHGHNAVGHVDRLQAAAAEKGVLFNGLHGVRNDHAGDPAAVQERGFPDGDDTVGDRDHALRVRVAGIEQRADAVQRVGGRRILFCSSFGP